jgi:hypothetical protein
VSDKQGKRSNLHRTANIDWTDLTHAKRLLPHLPSAPRGAQRDQRSTGVADTAVRPLYGTSGRPAAEAQRSAQPTRTAVCLAMRHINCYRDITKRNPCPSAPAKA